MLKKMVLLFGGLFLLSSCGIHRNFQIEWAHTGLYENGEEILLEIVIAKPDTAGPYPTLIFNHGSTGQTNPKVIETTAVTKSIADFFTQQGWLVVFPQRRGRGNSGGQYEEGLNLNRMGYSCSTEISLKGMERALQDIDAVVEYIKTKSEVDSERMLIGGASRGGILSIVYAGTRTHPFKGVINFVGGWKNDRCINVGKINTDSFKRGANFDKPTLWLYGLNDQYYSIEHSKINFKAFIDEGGSGTFIEYSLPPGQDGHFIFNNKNVWEDDLTTYLKNMELNP